MGSKRLSLEELVKFLQILEIKSPSDDEITNDTLFLEIIVEKNE